MVVLLEEGERDGPAELVVLESQRCGAGGEYRDPVEDPDGDPRLGGLDPEVHMGGCGHRVPGGDEADPHLHGILDDVVALLHLCAVEDVHPLAQGGLQVLDLGADEHRGVELGVDLVAFLQCVEGLHGHSVCAAEAESHEDKFGSHRMPNERWILNPRRRRRVRREWWEGCPLPSGFRDHSLTRVTSASTAQQPLPLSPTMTGLISSSWISGFSRAMVTILRMQSFMASTSASGSPLAPDMSL